MKTKLTIKKETLAELTSDQLQAVMGGAGSGSCTSCFCSCDHDSCKFDVVIGNLPAYLELACD